MNYVKTNSAVKLADRNELKNILLVHKIRLQKKRKRNTQYIKNDQKARKTVKYKE